MNPGLSLHAVADTTATETWCHARAVLANLSSTETARDARIRSFVVSYKTPTTSIEAVQSVRPFVYVCLDGDVGTVLDIAGTPAAFVNTVAAPDQFGQLISEIRTGRVSALSPEAEALLTKALEAQGPVSDVSAWSQSLAERLSDLAD